MVPENKTQGGRGYQMTEDREQRAEQKHRCQAMTVRGLRCRNEAGFYRIYEDGLEYLSCKLHFRDFRPHPRQVGTPPPERE